jgi:hypothetical protein
MCAQFATVHFLNVLALSIILHYIQMLDHMIVLSAIRHSDVEKHCWYIYEHIQVKNHMCVRSVAVALLS